jgi:hypothetical protein
MPSAGDLRGGIRRRDSDRGDLPGGRTAVCGRVPFDRLRLCLLQILNIGKEYPTMQIVIWKSPKALSGILRRLFKIKA